MSDKYYDISVHACGFVNRLTVVEPKDGSSFLACQFAALRGAKGERATPTYFDLKVVGDKAGQLLKQNKSVINDRSRQVFASVKLSDLTVKSFTRTKGEHEGETGFSLKSRLLAIESLSIDGVFVYRRADDPANGLRDRAPEASSPAASGKNRATA